MKISVIRNQDNSLELSTWGKGGLIKKHYVGPDIKEAKQKFEVWVNNNT